MGSQDARLKRRARVVNAHGAVYEIHEDMGDGYSAVVIDGGKTGGEGRVVWLDDRDFHPGGLEPEASRG